MSRTPSVGEVPTWFWQVEVVSTKLAGGGHLTALVCNGWSRIGSVVAYAGEFFDLLRALEWVVGDRHSGTEGSLLTLRHEIP